MTEPPVDGISITEEHGTVVIETEGQRWQGSPREAERLLTTLHYVLGRARPGTNIVSLFLNDTLWGGKVLETDRKAAIREARNLIHGLNELVARLEEES